MNEITGTFILFLRHIKSIIVTFVNLMKLLKKGGPVILLVVLMTMDWCHNCFVISVSCTLWLVMLDHVSTAYTDQLL